MRYAEALAGRGDLVTVLALRRSLDLPRQTTLNGVEVIRIQDRLAKSESSKWSYLLPILKFTYLASLEIARRHRRAPFDIVHAHNLPDFVVFSAWYAKMRGARILLDIHDLLPEFYSSKFGSRDETLLVRGLKLAERASATLADHVILANDLWLETYARRAARPDKCSVFINNVDRTVFRPRKPPEDTGQLVMFPGSLNWHQGVDIAIQAMSILQRRLPGAVFHIYGDGSAKSELIALTRSLGLEKAVRFFEPVPLEQIAVVMAAADLAVVPKRADSFGNEAYSTKIMEFMSIGVPVVVSETRIDRYYFDDSVVRFFPSGNPDAMADAMFNVLTDATTRRAMVDAAFDYVDRHCWDRRRQDYLRLVDSLCANP